MSEWMGCTGRSRAKESDAVADAVLVLVHDPGVGDVVDEHQDDEVRGEIGARRTRPRSPPRETETADQTTR